MKFLVVGDVMLDRYTYVSSNRKAAEADVPVWDIESEEWRLGGAANVAHNLKSLDEDNEVTLVGFFDSRIQDLCDKAGIRIVGSLAVPGVMEKRRFISNMKIVARLDSARDYREWDDGANIEHLEWYTERTQLSDDWNDFEKEMWKRWVGWINERYDAVIFSDYGKGTVSDEIVKRTRDLADIQIVDSKRKDLSVFKGMDVLKLNLQEYSQQSPNDSYRAVEELFKNVVITLGEGGALLKIFDQIHSGNHNKYVVHSEKFETKKKIAVDVTGCGDTHLAALAFCLVKTGDLRLAIKFANECSGKVVEKFGTSVCGK